MKIGITGGIGSGKSAVTAYLRKLGETVICADEAARHVTQPGQPGLEAVRRIFGDGFFLPDGKLDRKKLAAVVFQDSEKLKKLEEALHPLIAVYVTQLAESSGGRVFVDAALLVQTGLYKQMDAVWLVTADQEARVRRVMERDGVDEQSVLQRIKNQPDDKWLSKFADDTIPNDGSKADLYARIDKLLRKYS